MCEGVSVVMNVNFVVIKSQVKHVSFPVVKVLSSSPLSKSEKLLEDLLECVVSI